ncbi:MAG: D-glycerate dehydrogenase [Patescibacteria group bacterium]|nr:D-glycerate dehydrogenase [Patescibacteria group bacterium]
MKIFVTRNIPTSKLHWLNGGGREVVVSPYDRPLSASELLEMGAGSDILLTLLTDKITAEVADAIGPQLRMISNYAVGYDNIDVEAMTKRGIVVTNTPCDEVNESVAELTWCLMMSLARRVVEADQATRQGAYKGWEPSVFLGHTFIGKTLGIVGMGRIGSMVARRAQGFQMKVLYYNRSRDQKAESELGVEYAESLESLLSQSDFVSLNVPLTKETHHLINYDTIYKMKKGAILVNTARGSVVHEQALVDALRQGHLGGAGLDVFENEPNINPELVAMENVILTPHIASATYEAREKMGELAVVAINDFLEGKMPSNIVNKQVWDKRKS